MEALKQQYRKISTHFSPMIAFHRAVMRRVPKQYEPQIATLFRIYPKVAKKHRLETNTTMLSILWDCQPLDIPTLLERMTAGSPDEITYRVGELEPGIGHPVRIEFAIPEAA